MRVCIVGFEARKDIGSGIPRYTYELILNLNKVSASVNTIFVRYGSNPKVLPIFKRMLFASKLYHVRADIYHAVSPQLAIPIILSNKTPFVVTVHDLLPLHQRRCSKLEFELAKIIFHKCNIVIAISNYIKRGLIQYFDLPEDKIVTIPVGVDTETFRPMKVKRECDKKLILYVGGLTKSRGLGLVLKAFRKVIDEYNDVKLLVGGKGPDEAYFKALANQLGITNHVKFLGFIPEKKLTLYYNMADVFVYPSYIGFGLMLLEAMACGTPVISVKRLEIPEYVDDAAILVEPGNVSQLVDALLQVLTDDNLRHILSKRGLKRANEYSWERCAINTLRVYEKLCI